MARKKAATSRISRPIWKGHVTFGLVQIPVVLHSAESRYDLHFHLVDSRDHARIRYERINEATGEEVPWNEIVKAFEYDENNYVVLGDEDFKRAAAEATQSIEIEEFVDVSEISPMYFDRPYFLMPGKKGEKGYALLRDGLARTGKTGVARVVIRTREHLSALMVQGSALVLILLRFAQELRDPAELGLPEVDVKKTGLAPKERDMAVQLIESMSGEWTPAKYRDEYREKLMKWIEKKARSGGTMPTPEPEEEEAEPGRIINITDLLQQSLRRKGKSETGRTRMQRSAPKRRRAG
ncbi:MAG TPA: Ku protein [Phycisphaerae bacterium]|nr:Ku protein [Phycisphaerae bacterium]